MLTLVTRAREEAARTAQRLAEAGHEALIAPVIEIRSLPVMWPERRFDAAVATSAHAFSALTGEGRADILGAPLFAVGARTAQAARAAGFGDVRTAAGAAAGLIDLLRLAGPRRGRFLYLAGRDRKPGVEAALAEAGVELAVVETYAAEPAAAFAPDVILRLELAPRGGVLHFSRRSAALCLALAQAAGLDATMRRFVHVAISADAAKPLRDAGLDPIVAKSPEESELIAALPA